MNSSQSGSVGPFTEVMRDPGLRSVVTPTHDWKDPAGPWHYAVYLSDHPGLEEGQVLKVSGFAQSRWGAHSDVLDFKVRGWWGNV